MLAAVAVQVGWAVHTGALPTLSWRERYWPSGQAAQGVPNLPEGHACAQSETDVAPGAETRPFGHEVGMHEAALPGEYVPAEHMEHDPAGWPASDWW